MSQQEFPTQTYIIIQRWRLKCICLLIWSTGFSQHKLSIVTAKFIKPTGAWPSSNQACFHVMTLFYKFSTSLIKPVFSIFPSFPNIEQDSNVMLHKHVSWWRGMVAYTVDEPPGHACIAGWCWVATTGNKIEGYRGKLCVRWFNTKLGVPWSISLFYKLPQYWFSPYPLIIFPFSKYPQSWFCFLNIFYWHERSEFQSVGVWAVNWQRH